jgi:hypothetical protein
VRFGDIYEAFASEYGWTREYIQNRLTRPMVLLYWERMQKRKLREIRLQAALLGAKVDIRDEEDEARGYDYALRKQEDPLFDFPYDLVYFTPAQCDGKIAVTRAFGLKIPPEKRWDEQRKTACLGKLGIVARRCSMNDRLWSVWREARESGARLSLDKVKRMVRLDLKRSELYPPGWRDDSVPPPQWYLERLEREGKLDRIMRELDELSGET